MNGRFTLGSVMAAAALTMLVFAPVGVAAQDTQQASGRFRVLVPNLESTDGEDRGFGEDVADELRDLINDLATHQPVSERDFKRALDRFDIDEDDLNCIRTRQLATQMQTEVVVCGAFTRTATGYDVTAQFVTVGSGESFDVAQFTVPQQDSKQAAARHIYNEFETLVQQQRHARFCAEYAQSEQWDNAMTNCNSAIELNPQGVPSLYTRGMVHMRTENFESAIRDFRTVLELNPIHENALNAAGYTAAKLGDGEAARGFYNQFLELQPGNANVRMRVAYDLAQAGDPYGAMQLVEAGIGLAPDNVELHEQLGNFAFVAAQGAECEAENGEVCPEAAALYRRAITAYSMVFEAKGSEAAVTQIRNVIAAHLTLGELPEAARMAEQAIQTHGDQAQIWSIYADVLQRSERLDEAITALERVTQINPSYANVLARRGKWLMDSGRLDEALPVLQQAVQQGEQTGDVVANMIFSTAYADGVQKQDFGHASRLISVAKEFETTPRVQVQLDFWHGYSLYKQAEVIQQPQTLETAQRTLPMFQQAQRLFQASRAYQEQQPSLNFEQLINAAGTFIEIQEAIIRRGR